MTCCCATTACPECQGTHARTGRYAGSVRAYRYARSLSCVSLCHPCALARSDEHVSDDARIVYTRQCQVCDADATFHVTHVQHGNVFPRCAQHADAVARGPAAHEYRIRPINMPAARPDSAAEEVNMPNAETTPSETPNADTLAAAAKPAAVTVRRPDFTVRISRESRGIMLHVQSAALCAHLRGLASERTVQASTGRTVWSIPGSRLRNSSALFNTSDTLTLLLLDCALADGHEVRIADVMTASAAKDYVRDVMQNFSDYVRDYMSALRITGSVTIDETIIKRPTIAQV